MFYTEFMYEVKLSIKSTKLFSNDNI